MSESTLPRCPRSLTRVERCSPRQRGSRGIDRYLSNALRPWRKPLARHDPAKVLLDVAVSLALGGDACRDTALLRAESGVYGPVASDATISRAIAALAGDVAQVEKAIAAARATARAHVWDLAGDLAPSHGIDAATPLVIDLDATLVTAHSDKEQAAPTFKGGFGFRPLCAFLDHGAEGTGEPLAMLLRPGNAGSNTAVDHETVINLDSSWGCWIDSWVPGFVLTWAVFGWGACWAVPGCRSGGRGSTGPGGLACVMGQR